MKWEKQWQKLRGSTRHSSYYPLGTHRHTHLCTFCGDENQNDYKIWTKSQNENIQVNKFHSSMTLNVTLTDAPYKIRQLHKERYRFTLPYVTIFTHKYCLFCRNKYLKESVNEKL